MKLYLTNPARRSQYLLALGDCFFVVLVFILAYAARIVFYEGGELSSLSRRVSWLIVIAVAAHWLTFYLFELYNTQVKRTGSGLLVLILLSVFAATGLISIASYLFPAYKLGRLILSLHIPVMVLVIYLWRLAYSFLAAGALSSTKIAVVGDLEAFEKVNNLVLSHGGGAYTVVARVTPSGSDGELANIDGKPFGGIKAFVAQAGVQIIIIDEKAQRSAGLQRSLIDVKFKGVDIYDYPTFFSTLTGKIPATEISADWLLFAQQGRSLQPYVYLKLKLILDVVLALVGIVVTAPFMLVIIPLIKATSRGPVLFRQERLGQNEEPFMLFKFRTMITDAERLSGPVWSSTDDPRITPVGRFLRKTRLDELPQFFNILKGDMSFVGPRPIRKFFADRLAEQYPFYRLRFAVKPGVTGWAQVNGDYAGSDVGQLSKLEYELFYIKNQSIFLDLFIILKTINTVLARRGV